MRIVRDEPGRRLRLEGSEGPSLAPLGCLAVFLLPFLFGPLGMLVGFFTSSPSEPWLLLFPVAFSLVWYGVLGFAAYTVLRLTRTTRLLSVDRGAGEILISERGAFGLFSSEEVLPIARIARATVALVTRGGGRGNLGTAAMLGGRGLPLRVSLVVDPEPGETAGPERELSVVVDDLDKREEVPDFAFRLASAAGLGYYRVTRSDAREMEIVVSRSALEGLDLVPRIDRPADYALDAVAPAAKEAAAEERVPPFDPAAFKSPFRVEVWRPGQEVRFRRPFNLALVGCLTLFLAPFAAGLLAGALQADDLVARLVMGGFGTLLSLGFVALVVHAGFPRHVHVDWGSRTIGVAGPLSKWETGFSDVSAVELRGVRVSGKNSTSYYCEVRVHCLDPASGQNTTHDLVDTNSFSGDPDTPYRLALPLATDLAAALGIPRKVTDFA